MKTVVLIPARLQATRLPGKPLAMIGDAPMIVHVWRRAMEANIGPVIVATDSDEIARAVRSEGGDVAMTSDAHQSGSDRIYEALCKVDPDGAFERVINLQGDLPTIDPKSIQACADTLNSGCEIGTLAAEIVHASEVLDPNVVKVIGSPQANGILRALYFTRAGAPTGAGPLYHHIGIYAYRRAALEKFVSMPQSALEKRERLEQLRALEAGMRIDVAVVDAVPLGVDTPSDLERARRLLDGPGFGHPTASTLARPPLAIHGSTNNG